MFLDSVSFGMRVLTAVITVSTPSHSTWTLLVSLPRRVGFSVIYVHTDSEQTCWRKRDSDGRAGYSYSIIQDKKRCKHTKIIDKFPPFFPFRSLSRSVDNIYI